MNHIHIRNTESVTIINRSLVSNQLAELLRAANQSLWSRQITESVNALNRSSFSRQITESVNALNRSSFSRQITESVNALNRSSFSRQITESMNALNRSPFSRQITESMNALNRSPFSRQITESMNALNRSPLLKNVAAQLASSYIPPYPRLVANPFIRTYKPNIAPAVVANGVLLNVREFSHPHLRRQPTPVQAPTATWMEPDEWATEIRFSVEERNYWLSQFDSRVREEGLRHACRSLFAGGHYASSVQKACTYIDNMVKVKSGRHDKDGADLMRAVLSPDRPTIKLNGLKTSSNRNEQRGYMDLLAGLMTANLCPLGPYRGD